MPRKALDALVERQQDAVAEGRCGCLCGEPLPAMRKRGTRYRDERHRQKAYRARVDAAAADEGLPANGGVLTLRAVREAGRTGTRNEDARKARSGRQVTRREGVSIYLPSVEVAKAARRALVGVPEAREAVSKALKRRLERDEREAARAA